MSVVNSLNIKASQEDFETRIQLVEQRMNVLMDVIERYNRAKENVDQFMGTEDSNIEATLERIDINVKAAKKAHAALNETKISLQETVDQMKGMSKEVQETLSAATDAAKSTIEAAIKIDSIL